MELDHLIPRTWDWIWTMFNEFWMWTVLNPERALLLLAAWFLLTIIILLMFELQKIKRRWLLRGSKMPKKARKKWVRHFIVDGYEQWLERQVSFGKITEGECAAAVRMVRRAVSPEETVEAAIKWQNAQRKKAKLAELTLAEKIKLRLSSVGKRLLYTPAKIPGPPVPKAQAKALEVPKLKKGEMFARKTKTA